MANYSIIQGLALAGATIALCLLSACDGGSKGAGGDAGQGEASHQEAPMLTAKISELASHDTGAVTYKGKLFSGRAIELNSDGNVAEEHHYFNGYLQGSVRVFYKDGSPKSDTQFDKGIANGISFEWDSAGKMTQILNKNGVEVQRVAKPQAPATPPTGG